MVQLSDEEDVFVIRKRSEGEWTVAKQRASVRWLVSKAYNNKVPSNLQEPYYRDQNDGSERLKPQLVHSLANAELYCSCLANIYADPNYHNLSHWGIIQALARKGVYVAEPSDVALTETVLIQTGPIRMSAHMAVMEAVMALYIREVITAERVVGVVRRFSSLQASTELPVDQEEALLLWINKSCATLQAQAAAECRANQEEGGVPTFPLLQDLSDLSDGTCLAGLISLYCPDELSWPQIALSEPPRIADSLYNLQLVEKFCSEALPYNTFFLSLEDILYMHSSVKQNFLVLLSDLFYLFEINPAKCVRTPASVKDRVIELRRQNSLNSSGSPRRSHPELLSPSNSQQDSFSVSSANNPYNGGVVGDHRRPLSVYQPNDATSYRDDDRSNSADSDFVVQRAQGPMTLSRMAQHRRPQQSPGQFQQQRSLSPGSVHSDELVPRRPPRRHRQSASQAQSECGDDRLDDRHHFAFNQQQSSPAAGRPTVGRLSRRGSFSEESQLTVENFGGSQDNMHMLGRNPDKQPVVHKGRRPSRDSSQHRDLLKESNISFGDRDPFQEAERDRTAAMSRSTSRQELYDPAEQYQQQPVRPPSRNLFHESSIKAHFGGDDSAPQTGAGRPASAVSSEMEAFEREAVRRVESHVKNGNANNNLVIMLDANDDGIEESGQQPLNHQQQQQYQKPTSSFAQLSASKNGAAGINVVYMQGGNGSQGNQSTRSTSWGQQQQSKNRLQEQPHRLTNGTAEESGDTMASEMHTIKLRLEEKRRSIESEKRRLEGAMEKHKQNMGKQAFLQAIGQDVGRNMNQLQSKWSRIPEPINSPDLDNMDYDQYQNSLQTMNESLTELQDDIQRLSQQQSQVQHMQHMMHNGGPHSPSQAPPPISHHQSPYHQRLPPQQQQHQYQSLAGLYGPPAAPPQHTSQFFLHDQQPHPGAAGHRRQWGQPMAPEDIYQQMSSPGRARWAQPVRQPVMPQQQPPNPYGAPPHQSPYYDSPGNYQHHPPPLHHHQQQPQHLPHLQDPSAGYHQGYQHQQHMGGMMPGHTPPQPPPSTTSTMSSYPDYDGGMCGVYGGGELVRPSPVVASNNGVGGFRLHEPGSSAGQLPERVYSGSEYRQSVTRPSLRRQQSPVLHAPLPAPSLDDMEPQSVSFIGGGREEDASEVTHQRLAALTVNDDADSSPGNRTFRVHRGSSDNLPADSARRRPLVTSRTYKVPRRTPSPGNGVDSPTWARPGRGASQSPPRYEPASRQSPPKLSHDAVTSRRFGGATRSQSPAKRDSCTPDRQLSSRGDQHQLPQDQEEDEISPEVLAAMKVDKISADANPDLGFVISFESDAAPRKPKPKLGARRGVSKASSNTSVDSAGRRPPPPMTSTPQQPPISSGKTASAFSTYTRRSGAGIDGVVEGADQPLSLRGLSGRIGEDHQDAAEKFEIDESVPLEEMRPLRQERGDSAPAPMGVGLVIGDQLASPKSETLDEMDRKKERILMMSLKRKEQSEAARRKKEEDTLRRKEEEARKEEEKLRKKEEEKERKERIFEQYKLKKAIEEAEKNGTAPPPMPAGRPATAGGPPVRSRARPPSAGGRPARPRSVVERGATDPAVTPSRGVHGSSSNLAAMSDKARSSGGGAGSRWGSNTSLSGSGSRSRRGSNSSLYGTESRYGRPVASHSGRKTDNDASTPGGGMRKDGGHRTSTGSLSGPRRSRSRLGSRTNSSNSLYDDPDAGYRSSQFAHSGRRVSAIGGAARGALSKSRPDINRTFSKSSLGATAPAHKSLANLFGGGGGIPRYSETDSGLGRDTPTRRGVSPAGSLPPGLVSRRRNLGDDASDVSSVASYDYNGPRLFKQPASKSNRSMMLNAVEYCVFPGAVNREAKHRVLEEIASCEAKHFLILFRDARCQFRALYWYEPETDEVVKLYGTGPKQASDNMFDRFFKYNSGGKCFSQIHTKHLSATIDAFTIHDALWQGKRPSLPSKRDMKLVT